MPSRPPPPESVPKAEASEDGRERFEALAKGLFGVSREALAEEERKYEAQKKRKKG
jgi:hypothetical protein